MLKVITHNCHGLMSSIHDILHLCDQYDLIFLQETWLFKHELSILNNLHVQFEAFGCSAIDDSNGIVRGRPYGGLGVLIRKSFRPISNFHTYSSRLRFKYTLRICRQNEQAIRANAHAKALLEKDMLSFWKGVKKENNSRLPLSSKVNNCVGEENICKMWQTHYQTLF